MGSSVKDFEKHLLLMDRAGIESIMQAHIKESGPVGFVESIVVPVLESIGEGWESGSVSLSQVYMSGRICEEIIDKILSPEAAASKNRPSMGLAVLEDHHMLGKRIVYSVLRANLYDPMDYGRITTGDLARRVKQDQIEMLLISTLMLPSALQVKELVRLLKEISPRPKIIVGGAPFRFDRNLFLEVGADATADKASEVVETIRHLTGERL